MLPIRFLIFLILICCYCLTAAASPKQLFHSDDDEITTNNTENVIRERKVSISFEGIHDEFIELNFFDDITLVAQKTKLDYIADSDFSWFGKLEESDQSVILISKNGYFACSLRYNNKHYSVRYIDDSYVIQEFGQVEILYPDPLPPPDIDLDGDNVQDTDLFRNPTESVDDQIENDDGTEIDLLVLYTPEASAAGAGIETEIQLSFEKLNEILTKSNSTFRFNLVKMQKHDISEEGTSTEILNRLYNDESAEQIRNQYKADIVSLWFNDSTDTGVCGLAFIQNPSENANRYLAKHIVNRTCLLHTDIIMAHEIGHNMGLQHEHEHSSENAAYPYGYGHYKSDGNFFTIMATGKSCTDCSRINYFSNPNITKDHGVIGSSNTNAVQAMENLAFATANFNKSKGGVVSLTISEGDDKIQGCFIATAAYGSPNHPHVMQLKLFRDHYLKTNKLGTVLIKGYYKLSPIVLEIVGTSKIASLIMRALIAPFVFIAYFPDFSFLFLLICLVLIFVVLGFRTKAFLHRSS